MGIANPGWKTVEIFERCLPFKAYLYYSRQDLHKEPFLLSLSPLSRL